MATWLRQKHCTHQPDRENICVSWSLFAQPRHFLPDQIIQMGQQQHQEGWGGRQRARSAFPRAPQREGRAECQGASPKCPGIGTAGIGIPGIGTAGIGTAGTALLGLAAALAASADALEEMRTNSSFCKGCCGWNKSQEVKPFLHLPAHAPRPGNLTNQIKANNWS